MVDNTSEAQSGKRRGTLAMDEDVSFELFSHLFFVFVFVLRQVLIPDERRMRSVFLNEPR